jgi:hypothetical protein
LRARLRGILLALSPAAIPPKPSGPPPMPHGVTSRGKKG